VSSEVDEEPVWGRLEGGKALGHKLGEGGHGGLPIEEAEHLESLAFQLVRDGMGIPDGIEEGGDAMGVGIDADDNGQTVFDAWRNSTGFGVLHRRTQHIEDRL
jgi:hypothetical protein